MQSIYLRRFLPGRNIYLDTVERRHEARKRFLPLAGIPVADKPTQFLVEQAEAAYDIALSVQRRGGVDQRFIPKAEADRYLMRHALRNPLPTAEQIRHTMDVIDGMDQDDDGVLFAIRSYPGCWGPKASYLIYNSSMATTAAPVKQPTGTAIRTMMQLKVAAQPSLAPQIIEWGASFDGSSAATPGQIELVETGTVGATSLSTAYALADIMPFEDPNAAPNSSGASGVPFNLGTSASGFATASVTEGSTTATRGLDTQLLPPTGPYLKQMPLGREPVFGYYQAGAALAQNYLRVRNTFGTSVNATFYLITEF